jgi:hypothetical protein
VGQVPGFSRDAFLDGINLPHQGRRGYWIQQESTFWRRSLWEKAGGRIPDLKLAGDLALWAAFYRHAPLVGVDYPLGGFRKIEGQRSRVSFDVYFAEAMNALDQMRADIGWRPRQAMAGSVRTYTADRIINPNLRAPVADWRLQRYGFTL